MRSVEWRVSPGLVPYLAAIAAMEGQVEAIRRQIAWEQVWLLEHPSLYTAGTSAKREDLLDPGRLPVFACGRGGQFTYHGPGQRVAYVMLDLRPGRDVRAFVFALEGWLIGALGLLGVEGFRREGLTGVWVAARGRDAKIAAIGIRLKHWISYHGVSLNVAPDLGHFAGIKPCGIDAPVTSLADLGRQTSMADVDQALMASFRDVFAADLIPAGAAQPAA
jgi:lipoyl(octanoyl) transferase